LIGNSRAASPDIAGTILAPWRFSSAGGAVVKRLFRPIGFVLVALYFAVDAIFSYVTKPIVAWIGSLRIFGKVRAWIISLNAYAALALFAVPVMVLEPVKPMAAYLMATGHLVSGLGSLVGAEILKLTVVERLFQLNRSKLLSIRAFAWGYGYWRRLVDWVQSSSAWRALLALKARFIQFARGFRPRKPGSDEPRRVTRRLGRGTQTDSWPHATPRGIPHTARSQGFEPSTANVSRGVR
jgi:hypothetical protein